MPLYEKTDSWGEFVFDFAWADAYRRAGMRYFPKLVSAVPFTPATGRRLLTAEGRSDGALATALARAAVDYARDAGVSSLHVLFPAAGELPALAESDCLQRRDCQFHWQNRGYASFDDFLETFSADKRKKARRERRRVTEAGIGFRWLGGDVMTDALWQAVMPLYASTFWRRGREPYLNAAFFREIARTMPESLLVLLAEQQGSPVATAIFFRSEDTLYGRYWGSTGDYHSLHFETCYHQGIEYCVNHGLARFEPGTQGEHKLSRGFAPTRVHSAHWLADPRFAKAVDHYVAQEGQHIDGYMEAAAAHLPYRRSPE